MTGGFATVAGTVLAAFIGFGIRDTIQLKEIGLEKLLGIPLEFWLKITHTKKKFITGTGSLEFGHCVSES